MSDFIIENSVLVKYKGGARSVTVPVGVTIIGMHAFEDLDFLEEVRLPEGVTHILDCAFLYCEALTHIALPQTLAYIGNFAFAECWALTHVALPASLLELGYNAFACTGLAEVSIPPMVTTIPEGAFWKCKGLVRAHLPASVTTIEAGAFSDCAGLTEVILAAPDGVWLAADAPSEQPTQALALSDPTHTARLLRTEACDKYLERQL